MRYFKNSEIARLYNVSEKAVRNWIERASAVGLELFAQDDKQFIVDTIKNGVILEELAWKSRKYRNKRSHRDLYPKSEFYSLYTTPQLMEIINSLEIYREYPLKFRYTGKAAYLWCAYLQKLKDLQTDNLVSCTINLLRDNRLPLQKLIGEHSVNVADLGVGNGHVVTELLKDLVDQRKLRKYVGIDISPELLDLTEKNLKNWVKSDLVIEKHIGDIAYERFHQYLLGPHPESINLILFLGGTVANFRDPDQPLKTIRGSMGKDDILICTLKLDTLLGRRFFDFNLDPSKGVFPERSVYSLSLLNIDDSMYEPEQFYDEDRRCRFSRAKLKVSVTFHFNIEGEERVVELKKGESIQLADMWHYTDAEIEAILRHNGFEILHTSRSETKEFMLLIAKLKTEESELLGN